LFVRTRGETEVRQAKAKVTQPSGQGAWRCAAQPGAPIQPGPSRAEAPIEQDGPGFGWLRSSPGSCFWWPECWSSTGLSSGRSHRSGGRLP